MTAVRRCPKCKAEVPLADHKAAFAPFCSDRCRLLDLGAWLDGEYRIAGAPVLPEAPAEDEDDAS